MQLLCCVLRFLGYLFYFGLFRLRVVANVPVWHKFEWLFIVGRRQIGFIIWASVIEIRFNAFAKYMMGVIDAYRWPVYGGTRKKFYVNYRRCRYIACRCAYTYNQSKTYLCDGYTPPKSIYVFSKQIALMNANVS